MGEKSFVSSGEVRNFTQDNQWVSQKEGRTFTQATLREEAAQECVSFGE